MTEQINLNRLRRGSQGLIFTILYFASMIIIFIGERLILESTKIKILCAIAAGVGFIVSGIGRILRYIKIPSQAKSVEAMILFFYLLGLSSLFIYAAQADFIFKYIHHLFSETQSAERLQGGLSVVWPIIWFCAIISIVFIEISYAPMDVKYTLEVERIKRSVSSGLVLSLTVCILFVGNFIFAEFNKKFDLSYFKTTRPSESSRKMVANLSKPMKVILFFPGANEVLEQTRDYFDELKKESRFLSVQIVDHAMQPKLAKEYSVYRNGTVVLVSEQKNEKIQLGDTLELAKRKLKKLDFEFQGSFIKVAKNQKVAYFTVGHDELNQDTREEVTGTSIIKLRTLLFNQNYNLKDLGLNQGLGDAVPSDASVVIIAGPKKDFLPSEIDALQKYIVNGGRIMMFLDPESELTMDPLLNPIGLKFLPVKLANDKLFVRATFTKGDHNFLYSNRFSSHPSVQTLSRNSNRAAVIMLGSGYFEEVQMPAAMKTKVQITIRSMDSTWNDINQNLELDSPPEHEKIYDLAAIVTFNKKNKSSDEAKDKSGKNKTGKDKTGKTQEMKVMVVADADMITDRIFVKFHNPLLVLDGLKWLVDEEEFIGDISSEEDIRIVHTREKDQLWFYLTIFGIPSLVLAFGIFFTYHRRKSS